MKEKSRYRGWLDLKLIRALSDEQKQNIIDLQKRHGLKVTDFDQL
jgi:hypothetical protein